VGGTAGTEAVRPRRILIVDDQPTLAKAIRRMLAEYEVAVVSSAREALARLERGERYDVILSDLMMPEISGMELHARVARIAPDQVDSMVFMTGGAFTDQARAFFEQVQNPTIEKPFDRAALIAVIEPLIR
jgi:CheY-like chemotaxis protein